jgi:hypothetical protein
MLSATSAGLGSVLWDVLIWIRPLADGARRKSLRYGHVASCPSPALEAKVPPTALVSKGS